MLLSPLPGAWRGSCGSRAGINYYNNWTGSRRRHDDFPARQKDSLDLLVESRVEEDARQRSESPANVHDLDQMIEEHEAEEDRKARLAVIMSDPEWLPF